MKKSKTSFIMMAFAIVSSFFLSCQKDNSAAIATDSVVEFAISNSHLKNSPGYNMIDADKIVLTIQFSDGTPTKYTDSEIKIEQMNGNYYTKKITLKTGNYKLIKFIILDANGNTIFTTPLIGSQEAPNVDNPLPINFTVTKDVTTPVSVQVLSSENKSPEDFGLSHFPIIEVKTFGFMIGVADKETGVVLSAKLTVSNGTYSYVQNLDAKLNNVVTVKDNLSNYTLNVEKSGYKTYSLTYTIDSLKMYKDSVGNLPLLIELEKDLSFADGFESNSLDNFWTVDNGAIVAVSSEQTHSGSQSLRITAQGGSSVMYHDYSAPLKGKVSIWVYDTFAQQYGPYCALSIWNTSVSSGNGNFFEVIIVDWDGSKYTLGTDVPNIVQYATVNRTVGWHKWEIDCNDSNVEYYIDNILVGSNSGDYRFNKIQLNTSYHDGSFYFDDFSIIPM